MKILHKTLLLFLISMFFVPFTFAEDPICPVSGDIDTIAKVEKATDTTLLRYNAWDSITSPLTVTVTAKEGCTMTLSLVSYEAHGSTWPTSFPQTLYKSDTKTLSGETYTFTVDVPDCYYQVDFVIGSDLIPSYSDETNDPYGVYANDKLIAWGNGGKECETQSEHHHHSSHNSYGYIPVQPVIQPVVQQVCLAPSQIQNFNVGSAIPNDHQNELTWNTNITYTVKEGDTFNPFTGQPMTVGAGYVLMGANFDTVTIRWRNDGEDWSHTITAVNDGFEPIGNLSNGVHHWFSIRPINECGEGIWSKEIDPLP